MITAICNQKGGVGKSTLTVGLAQVLATPDSPVLVVDIDPQANTTKNLGVEPDDEMFTALDVMAAARSTLPATVAQTVIEAGPGWPGVHLMPSERNLATREVDNSPGRESQLRAALSPLYDAYRHILIDCPPSLGLLTVNALTAADQALIVTELRDGSIDGVQEMLTTIALVRESYNPALTLAGIVVNKWLPGRSDLSGWLAKAQEAFGTHLLDVSVPLREAIPRATTQQQPVGGPEILHVYQTIAAVLTDKMNEGTN